MSLLHKIRNNSIQVDCKPNNIDDNQCPVIPHYGNDNPSKEGYRINIQIVGVYIISGKNYTDQ